MNVVSDKEFRACGRGKRQGIYQQRLDDKRLVAAVRG